MAIYFDGAFLWFLMNELANKIDFIPTASCIFATSSLSYMAAHVAKGTFRLKVQIVVSMVDTI